MIQYFFYIQDGRYSVAQLLVVEAREDAQALAKAREYLLRSPHYRSIDVLEGDREVGRAER
jgi:hypothetical protein